MTEALHDHDLSSVLADDSRVWVLTEIAHASTYEPRSRYKVA
jgi:hypothetical protein